MLAKAKTNEKIKFLLGKFDSDCPLDLDCLCCEQDERTKGSGTLGFYDPNTRQTRICADNVVDQNRMEDTLYEELSHALQNCNKLYYQKFSDSCTQCLCKEVQAKYGAPHAMPVHPGQVDEYLEILRIDALQSCYEHCQNKTQNEMEIAFTEAVLRCRTRDYSNE